MNTTRFSAEQVESARQYWGDLSNDELLSFWKHYTTGKGAGIYGSVAPDTSFLDFLVLSAAESGQQSALNC